MLQSGDTVYGTLPMHLVAEICARGVRYRHLEVELPKHLRGQDLTAEQLTKLNAELVEYAVTRRTSHDRFLALGGDLEELLCAVNYFSSPMTSVSRDAYIVLTKSSRIMPALARTTRW